MLIKTSSLIAALVLASALSLAEEPEPPAPSATPPERLISSEGSSDESRLTQPGEIARHVRRPGVPFRDTKAAVNLRAPEGREGPRLRPPYEITRDGKYVLPRLPQCRESAVVRESVYRYSLFSELLDIVFFEASDEREAAQAQRSALYSVAYRAEKPMRDVDPEFSIWPIHALRLGVDCLPSRLRFVTDGGERYLEFRKGEAAWREN